MTETTTAPEPTAPTADSGLSPNREPTGGEQPRNKGRYAEKREREPQNLNLAAVARNEIRRLAAESDAAALVDVAPKGQKNTQTKDPAPQSAKATDAKGSEETSPAATLAATHMADARKALVLDGFTEAHLSKLAPEEVLALGKIAKTRQADVGRKLEEAAKTKAVPTSDAPAADPGSSKPATTAPVQAKTEEADPFDALVKEHFAAYAEDADFSKSLGGFSKALATHLSTEIQAGMKGHAEQIAAMRADMVKEIREEAARETEFERAVDALKDDFPESSSVDGRSALRDLFVTLAKEGKIKDIKQGVLSSADALWASNRRTREAAAAKEKASRDARKNGQPITGSHGAGPGNRPLSIKETAIIETRKALAEQ